MTVISKSPMNKDDDVDQAISKDFLEITIKENEVEQKKCLRRQKLMKCLNFTTDVSYDICLLFSLSLLTMINVCSNIDVNTVTGEVKMMGDSFSLNLAVQVFLFALSWMCRRTCFWMSFVALFVMWIFTMKRTGVWIWIDDNMEPGLVITHLQPTDN